MGLGSSGTSRQQQPPQGRRRWRDFSNDWDHSDAAGGGVPLPGDYNGGDYYSKKKSSGSSHQQQPMLSPDKKGIGSGARNRAALQPTSLHNSNIKQQKGNYESPYGYVRVCGFEMAG